MFGLKPGELGLNLKTHPYDLLLNVCLVYGVYACKLGLHHKIHSNALFAFVYASLLVFHSSNLIIPAGYGNDSIDSCRSLISKLRSRVHMYITSFLFSALYSYSG